MDKILTLESFGVLAIADNLIVNFSFNFSRFSLVIFINESDSILEG